jgi:hypothetical protein
MIQRAKASALGHIHVVVSIALDAKPTEEFRMSLKAKLDAFKADFDSGKPPYAVPRFAIEVMERATAELVASGAASRAKTAGDIAPSFSLKDPERNAVHSEDLLKKGPLIVCFYRGVWCPFCNTELQALEVAKPEFDKYGASVVAISLQNAPNRSFASAPSGRCALALAASRFSARMVICPTNSCRTAPTSGLTNMAAQSRTLEEAWM